MLKGWQKRTFIFHIPYSNALFVLPCHRPTLLLNITKFIYLFVIYTALGATAKVLRSLGLQTTRRSRPHCSLSEILPAGFQDVCLKVCLCWHFKYLSHFHAPKGSNIIKLIGFRCWAIAFEMSGWKIGGRGMNSSGIPFSEVGALCGPPPGGVAVKFVPDEFEWRGVNVLIQFVRGENWTDLGWKSI